MASIQGYAFKLFVFFIAINLGIGISHLLHAEAYSDPTVQGGLVAINNTTEMFMGDDVPKNIEIPESNYGSFFSSIWDFFLKPILDFLGTLFKVATGQIVTQTLEQFGFDVLLGAMYPFMKYATITLSSAIFTFMIWSVISQGFNIGEEF